MAQTFQQRIESVIPSFSLSGSSTPSQGDVDQFLEDGIKDVTNKIMTLKPQDSYKFSKEEDYSGSTGLEVKGEILSVVRDKGNSDLRPAAIISTNERYLAEDKTSLSYRSAFNPGYYVLNKKVYVVPAPTASQKAYISMLGYGTASYFLSQINNFPDEYEYLVSLYSQYRSIHAILASKAAPTLSISATIPVAPDTVDLSSNGITIPGNIGIGSAGDSTISAFTGQPTYSKPTVSLVNFKTFYDDGGGVNNPFGDNDPGDLSITATAPAPPTLTAVEYTSVTDPENTADSPVISVQTVDTSSVLATGIVLPTYTKPTSSIDMGQFETFIEDEEDSELAQVQLGRLQNELGQYQADMQNELNEFNKENVKYQGGVQESMAEHQAKNAANLTQAQNDLQASTSKMTEESQRALQNAVQQMQSIIADNQSKINEFQSDIQLYTQTIDGEVKEYQAKMSKYQAEAQAMITAWQKHNSDLLQQYSIDLQNELNEFNKENVAFQAEVNREITNAGNALAVIMKNVDIDLQEAIKNNDIDLQGSIKSEELRLKGLLDDYTAKLQTYQADLGAYQAQIGKDVQEHQTVLSGTSTEYQWLTDQYVKIKTEYESSFVMLNPNAFKERGKSQ